MNRRTFLNWLGLSWLVSVSPTIITLIMANTKDSLATNQKSPGIVFYVSPDGNDAWTGEQPTAQAGNGAFATIARARDAIRELKQQQGGILKQPVTVFLRGGTYFLPETLSFTAEDSGGKDFLITYKAYQQEKPIISGGRIIKGWKEVTLNDKTVWTTNIATVKSKTWSFHQLWVNGDRAQRCRYPTTGYLKVDQAPDVTPDTPWQEGQTRFKFRAGDLQPWQEVESGEAIVMTRWLESRLPIEAIDQASRIISFDYPSAYRIDPGDSDSSAAGIYYLENIREFLTEPGEWYLERKSGQVYYIPLPGEEISQAEIIAPVLAKLLDLSGDGQAKQFVEYLWFENLTFAHGEWYYSQDKRRSLGQAAVKGLPGAIYAQQVRFCTWKQCTIAHISNYAIDFADVCLNNKILECQFFDLGAGAIKIANYGNHQIIGCHIYNGGLIFHAAVAIWIGSAANNLVAHNHIHHFHYSGISVGWTWGSANNPTANNLIEFNHIHDLGKLADGEPLLNDNGGIYTLGVQPGTKIRSNLIHDIQAHNFGGWGIYLDEGSSQITVENNLVYRTRTGGFHLHMGKDNIVRNNIFAFGQLSQLERTLKENSWEDEGYESFTLENNIIYWQEGNLLAGKWADGHYVSNRNLYWYDSDRPIRFGGLSWQQWQRRGRDTDSIVADPLFIAPERGDFRLQPNSPALKMGFKPLRQ
jgi:parallel beta-helix repeat protein